MLLCFHPPIMLPRGLSMKTTTKTAASPPIPPVQKPPAPKKASLLDGSLVRLFGTPLDDVMITGGSGNLVLARIYGFSYEGNYFKLEAATLFVVEGPGTA